MQAGLPLEARFPVLGEEEVRYVDRAEDPTDGESEVEKLGSLVHLVDLPLEAGPDVEIPDERRTGTSNGTPYHAEVDQSRHQQTLLHQNQSDYCVFLLNIMDQPFLSVAMSPNHWSRMTSGQTSSVWRRRNKSIENMCPSLTSVNNISEYEYY